MDDEDVPALSPLQLAIVDALDKRGIHATWVHREDHIRLFVKMAESMAAAAIFAVFDHPADLVGFRLIGWRVGTMEELKIARPVIWEVLALNGDAEALARHRAYCAATPIDWAGEPGVYESPPPSAAL